LDFLTSLAWLTVENLIRDWTLPLEITCLAAFLGNLDLHLFLLLLVR